MPVLPYVADFFQHLHNDLEILPIQAAQRPAYSTIVGPTWLFPCFCHSCIAIQWVSGGTDLLQMLYPRQGPHQKLQYFALWRVLIGFLLQRNCPNLLDQAGFLCPPAPGGQKGVLRLLQRG